MRIALLILIVAEVASAQVAKVKYPDPKLTPGVAATDDVRKICSTKWGRDERHVTEKMKKQVCEEYGAEDCPGPKWEIDHLISRELGGADVIRNLGPQPAPEFHEKDVLENLLHRELCANPSAKALKEARKCLVDDWRACYKKKHVGKK